MDATAIATLTRLVMTAFAAAAKTDERLLAARARLGAERFADAATAAIRGAMKREVVDRAEELREELAIAGGLAAKTAMMTVVAAAVRSVLAAGELPEPGTRVLAFGRLEATVVEVYERRADGRVAVLVRKDDGTEAIPFADELEAVSR